MFNERRNQIVWQNLFLVRHGESTANEINRFAGTIDAPLTALGEAQARRAGEDWGAGDIDRVYLSPLLRARQTAEIIATALGMAVETDQRLSDIRSGFDGRPVADYLAAIAADPVDARVDGGESLRDYQHRVGGFLRWLRVQPFACVLIVAHEETLRILEAHCTGQNLSALAGKAFANAVPYDFQSPSGN